MDWRDIPGTKLSFFKDSIGMVTSLFVIHRRLKNKGYRVVP